MSKSFSDLHIRRLAVEAVDSETTVTDPQTPGLCFRRRPGRAPAWLHVFRRDGKLRKHQLGTYPELSLSAARSLVSQRRSRIIEGAIPEPPTVAHRAARAAAEAEAQAKATNTVQRLYERWHKLEITGAHRDGGALIEGHFTRHVLPRIGTMAVGDVSRRHILDVLDALKDSPRTSNVVLQLLRRLFAFAVKREIIESNPASAVERRDAGGREQSRDRFLAPKEIGALVTALPGSGLNTTAQSAIWILMSTLVRVGALYDAKWSDLSDRWAAAGTRDVIWRAWDQKKKGKREQYDVPLSNFARSHFRSIRNEQERLGVKSQWIMHSRVSPDGSDFPSKPATLNKQVQDRQSENVRKGRASSTALVLPAGQWTIHDLRRTGASRMKALGVQPEIRRACMNHTPVDRLEQIYDREEIPLEWRQQAFEKLGRDLARMMADKERKPGQQPQFNRGSR